MVTVSLGVLTGLVAQWSEEDQKGQQMISIPLETYAQGCVKDVEEGLEVKLSPRAATCPLCTIISLWSLQASALLGSQPHQQCEDTLTAAQDDPAGVQSSLASPVLVPLRWPRGSATR